MPVRAMWKGVIRFGKASVPVKLYAAVSDRKVHFRLLHAKDHAPVQQKMVHARTGEPVPPEMIRRGYQVEPGRYILLTEEELQALEPPPSREIRVRRFIEPQRITHQWFDRPYFLGPDEATGPYFALAQSLQQKRMCGIANWTMRRKNYNGILYVGRSGHLMMSTLRHQEEVLDLSGLQAPLFRELTRQELQMAQQLVGALEDAFDPQAFRDEYRERVRELVMAKAAGSRIEFPRPRPRKPEVTSLAEMLKQSIARAKEEKKVAHGR